MISLRLGVTPSLPSTTLEPATHFCDLMKADSSKDVTCTLLAIEVMGMCKLPSEKAAANAAAMAAQTSAEVAVVAPGETQDTQETKVQQTDPDVAAGAEDDAANELKKDAVPSVEGKNGEKNAEQTTVASSDATPLTKEVADTKIESADVQPQLAAASSKPSLPVPPTPKQQVPASTPATPVPKESAGSKKRKQN